MANNSNKGVFHVWNDSVNPAVAIASEGLGLTGAGALTVAGALQIHGVTQSKGDALKAMTVIKLGRVRLAITDGLTIALDDRLAPDAAGKWKKVLAASGTPWYASAKTPTTGGNGEFVEADLLTCIGIPA